MHLNVMPLKIHIGSINAEFDENNNLHKKNTLKFTNEQMDKFKLF
jgi:chromate reductase, NAD(P)H dehydrogenase (quinone)